MEEEVCLNWKQGDVYFVPWCNCWKLIPGSQTETDAIAIGSIDTACQQKAVFVALWKVKIRQPGWGGGCGVNFMPKEGAFLP